MPLLNVWPEAIGTLRSKVASNAEVSRLEAHIELCMAFILQRYEFGIDRTSFSTATSSCRVGQCLVWMAGGFMCLGGQSKILGNIDVINTFKESPAGTLKCGQSFVDRAGSHID